MMNVGIRKPPRTPGRELSSLGEFGAGSANAVAPFRGLCRSDFDFDGCRRNAASINFTEAEHAASWYDLRPMDEPHKRTPFGAACCHWKRYRT
jgi:hypothetical protein